MDIKYAVVALLLIGGAANGAPTFGIVKLDGDGHAYLVTAQPLPTGRDVRLQFPNERAEAACCKSLRAGSFKPLPDDQVLATNELADTRPRTYRAEVPREWSSTPFVGLAVVGRKLKARNTQDGLVAQERDGRTYAASACFSKEGLHLIERVGQTERTHLYLGLGYDLERTTCPE